MKSRKKLQIWSATALGIALSFAPTLSASPIPGAAASSVAIAATTTRTVHGTAVCANGRAVVGVWIDSSAGGSKWATWHAVAGKSNAAYYSASIKTPTVSTSIQVRVGCGGTPTKWWSDNGSPRVTVKGTRVLNLSCSEAAGKANRCSWPKAGLKVTSNLGAPGNCTWGALEKWYSATGYYPKTSGNATVWDTTAANNGWRVSAVPHVRSIVVFEAHTNGSGSAGHVGWVTGVKHVGSGKFDITVVEMNAYHAGTPGGFNKYNTWTYRHTNGQMKYIIATI